MTFGQRLADAVTKRGGLVVGIDPHPSLLHQWGLPDSATGAAEFATTVVETLAGDVAMVKPQSALFERFGSAGIAVLENVLALAHERGLLTLLDAKRSDIGSTMAAYAETYLSSGSPLAADAVTLSPYLGFESLRPALTTAIDSGRGVFVLALTSNPEGQAVQHAVTPSGRPVAADIADAVGNENAGDEHGSVGLVVGATTGTAGRHLGIDFAATRGPLLAPGVGAQGATMADLGSVFGAAFAAGQVLPTASRSVLKAGPDPDRLQLAAQRLQADLRQAVTA